MATKLIKVDEGTHARLVQLAAERGTTIGGYVADLVGAQRTHAEWEAIAQQSEVYLREQFGFDPTPVERAEFEAEHERIMDDLDRQFALRRDRAHRASA